MGIFASGISYCLDQESISYSEHYATLKYSSLSFTGLNIIISEGIFIAVGILSVIGLFFSLLLLVGIRKVSFFTLIIIN